MAYTYEDIMDAYKAIGIQEDSIVSLKTDLRWLGEFEDNQSASILDAHQKALFNLIDFSKGTLFFQTFTLSLCNKDKVFDLHNTPSEAGVLTEELRKSPGTVRSFHPFLSCTAIGKHANYLCENVSLHGFGGETPYERLLELNAMEVSVGIPPRYVCNMIHQAEQYMGVPYRYTKEFFHPVIINGSVMKKKFYMFVWYRACHIKRDSNRKIFNSFLNAGYPMKIAELGRGNVYSYSLDQFYNYSIYLLKNDPYIWLENEPNIKPYLK